MPAKKVLRVKIDLMNKKIECKNKGFLCELEKNGELYGGRGVQRPTPFVVSFIYFLASCISDNNCAHYYKILGLTGCVCLCVKVCVC